MILMASLLMLVHLSQKRCSLFISSHAHVYCIRYSREKYVPATTQVSVVPRRNTPLIVLLREHIVALYDYQYTAPHRAHTRSRTMRAHPTAHLRMCRAIALRDAPRLLSNFAWAANEAHNTRSWMCTQGSNSTHVHVRTCGVCGRCSCPSQERVSAPEDTRYVKPPVVPREPPARAAPPQETSSRHVAARMRGCTCSRRRVMEGGDSET